MNTRRMTLCGLAAALLGAVGCTQEAPDAGPAPAPQPATPVAADLVPAPAPNDVQFCDRDGGNLRVTVRNNGSGNAGASTTEVAFTFANTTQAVPAATPAINAGATAQVSVAIPSGCFDPDCDFRITVDQANVVPEDAAEGNNSVTGRCIG